jgi:hypothetical protein
MRFINLFLIGYAVVVVGIVLGLWQAGKPTLIEETRR